jgi:hypothetical protein
MLSLAIEIERNRVFLSFEAMAVQARRSKVGVDLLYRTVVMAWHLQLGRLLSPTIPTTTLPRRPLPVPAAAAFPTNKHHI